MDSDRFDHLARTLSSSGTRRGLLRLLAATPVAGGLLSLLAQEPAGAGKKAKPKRKSKSTSTSTSTSTGTDGNITSSSTDTNTNTNTGTNTSTNTNTDTNTNTNAATGGNATNSNTNTNTNTNTSTSTSTACPPTTCAAQGKTCGTIPDGCGGTLTCGTCPQPGQPCSNNVCGPCVSTCTGRPCGASDDCGGICACLGCCDPVSGACVAPGACCPSGGRCQDGACLPATATLVDCGGRCDAAEFPASTTVCGQTLSCPSCADCGVLGCNGATVLSSGPAGNAFYCVGSSTGPCPPGVSCLTTGSFCAGGICFPVCTGG